MRILFQVGDNGSGKTTLLKILLEINEPTKGFRIGHRSLRLAYFSQHHVDQMDMNMNAIEVLASKFPGQPKIPHYYFRFLYENEVLRYFYGILYRETD